MHYAIGPHIEQLNMENTVQRENQIILTELQQIELLRIERDDLKIKVSIMLDQFNAIEKGCDDLEVHEPIHLEDSLVGRVVRLIDYQRLQLASAKSRTVLKTKLEALTKQNK